MAKFRDFARFSPGRICHVPSDNSTEKVLIGYRLS